MEKKCSDPQVNTFFHNVEPRFKSFKKNIQKQAKKSNIIFDEDVFMDTLIRCSETFSIENATDTDIDQYFWIAFKQNIFSNFSRNKFNKTVKFDDFGDGIIDEEYNSDIDEIIGLIKSEVKTEFGEQIYDAWILHICNGLTYCELENNGYEGLNLHNEFRQIKRYICQKLLNKNYKLKSLLHENGFLI